MSRNIAAQGKLRPEWEMDNFFCSHRCTSTVRLRLGARRCSSTDASRQFTPCFRLASSF